MFNRTILGGFLIGDFSQLSSLVLRLAWQVGEIRWVTRELWSCNSPCVAEVKVLGGEGTLCMREQTRKCLLMSETKQDAQIAYLAVWDMH